MELYWVAHFKLDIDVTVLFPYVNSEIKDAIYYEKPHYIAFPYDGHTCLLHPDEIVVGYFKLQEKANRIVLKLIEYLNDIYARKGSIKPNYKMKRYVPVLDIYKLLPRTNCADCGYPACMAFAAAVSKGEAEPQKCKALSDPITENVVYPVYDDSGNLISTVAINIDSRKRKEEFDKQRTYAKNLEKKISTFTQKNSKKNIDVGKYGITKREMEVLRLMAEGLTNIEIAGLLSISPHTAKSHVLHIFNKIGVNDRTQASVWAARHNLV